MITDVMNDKDMRKQLLLEALADFSRMEVKYGQLKELSNIFAAVDRLRKRK